MSGLDPFDPNRFLGDPSENSKRKVRFDSGATSQGSARKPARRRDDAARASTGGSASTTAHHQLLYVFLGIAALALGMWASPLLSKPDIFIQRALDHAMTFRTELPSVYRSLLEEQPSASPLPFDLSEHIKRAVRAAVKDSVGRRDFALAADGARITPLLTSSFDTVSLAPARPIENILDEDLRAASCWSFPDNHAQPEVGFKIPTFIYPTNVTIDHVPREIAADIGQAPRSMVLWGLLEGKGNQERYKLAREGLITSQLNALGDGPPITGGGRFLPLASFDYAIDADFHIQTFAIDSSITTSRIYFGVFVLEIRSNWGSSTSRLYRVRVHGEEVST